MELNRAILKEAVECALVSDLQVEAIGMCQIPWCCADHFRYQHKREQGGDKY